MHFSTRADERIHSAAVNSHSHLFLFFLNRDQFHSNDSSRPPLSRSIYPCLLACSGPGVRMCLCLFDFISLTPSCSMPTNVADYWPCLIVCALMWCFFSIVLLPLFLLFVQYPWEFWKALLNKMCYYYLLCTQIWLHLSITVFYSENCFIITMFFHLLHEGLATVQFYWVELFLLRLSLKFFWAQIEYPP